MPEEQEEYLDNVDNENTNGASKSSANTPSDNKKDSTKYKAKTKDKTNNDKKNNSNSKGPSLGSRLGGAAKNAIANKAFNKAASAIPALRVLNAANNIRKMLAAKKRGVISGGATANASGDEQSTSEDNNTNTNNVNDTADNTSDSGEERPSFNPLASIFGSNNSFMGNFSFFGRISLPLRLAIILGPAFLGFFLLFIIISIPLGAHSSLLSIDDGMASTSSGNIDYGDYELSSYGHEILHEPLDSFLESQGSSLEEFNNLIASNVDDAGYGTRAGVVAASVTLIAELGNNYSVKIPYFWGGGHGQMQVGASGNWGSSSCQAYANGQSYDYCGLDCSGFAAWAIYNGGFNIAARTAGTFQNLPGARRVSLKGSAVLQPGDLLESSGHIVIVVEVTDSGYVCAEASGNSTGVLFTTRSFNPSGFWGVDMEGFYERQVRS